MTSSFWMDDDDPAAKKWTMKEIYDDLGTRSDVAAALDITRWRMDKWLDRRPRIECPKPIRRFGLVDVYSIEEWRIWFKVWTEKRGKWQEHAKPNGAGTPFFTDDPVHRRPHRTPTAKNRMEEEELIRKKAIEAAEARDFRPKE